MAVETGQAIRAAIYTRLTTDTALKALIAQSGTIHMHRVMAPQDSPFPYLVDRLTAPRWPLMVVTYFLDLWYYGESPETPDAAIERIRTLLENWRITTGASEVGAGRMLFFSGGYIPSDNDMVWHYATQWTVDGISKRLTSLVGT